MSYSHTRAQLKRSSEFVYRRPKSLWIKIQVKTKLLNRRYDWISSESKKRRRRPAGNTAGLFSFRINPAITAGYAKVEITYQDGTSKIATVTSRYDSKNDWINLRAYGFTYSTPQLAISFKQPDAAPKEEIKVVAPKKTTITCIKGKTSKKVTAVKPKCPKGYKKK